MANNEDPNPPPNPQGQANDMAAQNDFFRHLIRQMGQMNQPRAPTIKSIPCTSYNAKNDFDLWIVAFCDSVRASHGLQANDPRLDALYLNWISTKLDVGETRSVYDNLDANTKANWAVLRKTLSDSFKNESEEVEFLNNEGSWKRTNGMSLRDYRSGLLLRMDKYFSDLKAVPAEFQRTAVRRFRLGISDPVLQAHILMTCVGDKQTLDSAYSVATTYENTLRTISKDNSASTVPTMAGLLTIPQLATLSHEPPQLNALSPYQEKTNDRLTALETSSKKYELDISELKTGLTEVREGVKTIKEGMAQLKVAPKSFYPREVRPLYPVARMPSNPFLRPYYPSGIPQNKPQTVRGLTGGPGYVNRPLPSQSSTQGIQARLSQLAQPSTQSPQIAQNKANLAQAAPNPVSAPNLGSVEGEDQAETGPEFAQTANPNLQYGMNDMGYGWVDGSELDYGYEANPAGVFAFVPAPF